MDVFVFVAELGVDYGICPQHGSQEAAELGTGGSTLRGLAVTGGVIAGASIVLAGTCAALAKQKTVEVTGAGIAVDLAERAWWPTWQGGRRPRWGDGS